MKNKKTKKKYRENTCQRKQSHVQDNIYVVRQFAYVQRVARISPLSGKKYKVRLQCFLSQETRQQQTLISKLWFSTSYAQDSQWATKRAKKISPP